MPNLNREQLIDKIYRTRVLNVRVPSSDLFGRKIFVKTTKNDLIRRLRDEFKQPDQITNLGFKEYPKRDEAIIEPVTTAATSPINSEPETKKRRGRPPGSKNKPKS